MEITNRYKFYLAALYLDVMVADILQENFSHIEGISNKHWLMLLPVFPSYCILLFHFSPVLLACIVFTQCPLKSVSDTANFAWFHFLYKCMFFITIIIKRTYKGTCYVVSEFLTQSLFICKFYPQQTLLLFIFIKIVLMKYKIE